MLVKEIMVTDPVTVRTTASISDAMAKMREIDVNQLPVLEGKKYRGILNYREILRRRSVKLGANVESFVVNSPYVSPEDDAKEVVKLIRETGLSALPVLEKEKLVGIVSRSDIISNIGGILDSENIKNYEIMSTEPIVVTEDETVESASIKMRGLDETEIPVVSKTDHLKGILRLDDIAKDTIKREKNRVTIGELVGEKIKAEATTESLMDMAVSVKRTDSLASSAELLLKYRLHILPVVDDDLKVIGIVGISDIIDAIDVNGEKEGVLVQITGLEPGDEDIYDVTFFMADKFLGRFSRITNKKYGKLNIHVMRYKTAGKTKYSVRTKLVAEPINLSIDHHDWNYGKCLSFIFEMYDKRLRKWKEK